VKHWPGIIKKHTKFKRKTTMKSSYRPQIENLEARMVMDAAGTHVLAADLVTPAAVAAESLSINFTKIKFEYKPFNDTAIVFVGGWGSSMYQYAFEGSHAAVGSGSLVEGALADRDTADHELGHTLGFRHEHTPPSAATDDVWVDGKIITGQNFDSALGGAGDDILIGGEGWDTTGGAGLDILIANTGADRTASGGANFQFSDGSVRFLSQGIPPNTAKSEPLPVLMVIANRDFYY